MRVGFGGRSAYGFFGALTCRRCNDTDLPALGAVATGNGVQSSNMAPRLRKTLPKDFAEQLATKSVPELIALFDTMELTAYGTADKCCALAYPGCPDE